MVRLKSGQKPCGVMVLVFVMPAGTNVFFPSLTFVAYFTRILFYCLQSSTERTFNSDTRPLAVVFEEECEVLLSSREVLVIG